MALWGEGKVRTKPLAQEFLSRPGITRALQRQLSEVSRFMHLYSSFVPHCFDFGVLIG